MCTPVPKTSHRLPSTPKADYLAMLCLWVQGALLVKNYPPSNLDASSENLFSSLIPDSRLYPSDAQMHAYA